MLTDQELQSLRNMGNESETAADEITRLRADLAKVTWQRNEAQAGLAAMTKSRDAAMRIVTAKDQQMSVLRTQQDQWSEARNTLESERAANARITADLAASQAECERLREALMRVQNFPGHPGGHTADVSADADDSASWRHGWICAVEAMQEHAIPDTCHLQGGGTE